MKKQTRFLRDIFMLMHSLSHAIAQNQLFIFNNLIEDRTIWLYFLWKSYHFWSCQGHISNSEAICCLFSIASCTETWIGNIAPMKNTQYFSSVYIQSNVFSSIFNICNKTYNQNWLLKWLQCHYPFLGVHSVFQVNTARCQGPEQGAGSSRRMLLYCGEHKIRSQKRESELSG